ncbi:MAG TPA: STAS domain-containing protein [Steroidobacteraceae bacterium]
MSGAGTARAPAANEAAVKDAGAGRFLLSGALTMASAARLRGEGLRAFAAHGGGLEIDLSAVARVDSASLALLIDWLAWARAAGRAMRFTALPAAMLALARLSDVESLLLGGSAAP